MIQVIKLAVVVIGGAAAAGFIGKRSRAAAAAEAAEAECRRLERAEALEKERAFIASLSPDAQRIHFETIEHERLENLRREDEERARTASSRSKGLIAGGLAVLLSALARSRGLHAVAVMSRAIAEAAVEIAGILATAAASHLARRASARAREPIGFQTAAAA